MNVNDKVVAMRNRRAQNFRAALDNMPLDHQATFVEGLVTGAGLLGHCIAVSSMLGLTEDPPEVK